MTTPVAPRLSLPLPRPNPLHASETLAELRAHDPVAAVTASSGEPAWLITRHADARAVLNDRRFGVAMPGVPAGVDGPADPADNVSLFQDPPGHTRLRRLVSAAFTPRRVAALRPRAVELADELIDRMLLVEGPVDLLEALALPLPITIISELLGVPVEERERFRRWADSLLSLPAAEVADPGVGWQELSAHVGELIARKRAQPSDDLLSDLIAVRDTDHDRLSEAELVMMAITLITAGYVTTSLALGTGVILLSAHGGLTPLRDDPVLVPTTVEEVLRFQTAAGDVARIAREDVEVAGVTIPAGSKVVVSLTSANRDEQRVTDPDRFDLARTDNPHLTFGHGVHHCLGASLARTELQVALERLAARLPGLTLACPAEEIEWRHSELFGDAWPSAVPVTW